MNYRPNYHARSLLKGKSFTLGLVLSEMGGGGLGGFWSRTIGGIADQTRETGYDFLIVGPTQGEGELPRGLRYLREGRVDALVVPGFLYSVRSNDLLHEMVIEQPIVLAEFYGKTQLPVVGLDPAPGIRAAVRHLSELGHREALWIGQISNGQEVAPERRKAFEKASGEEGLRSRTYFLEWDMANFGPYSEAKFIAESRNMFAEWLRQHGAGPCPTAILAYNELMGLGLYAALRDTGRRFDHRLRPHSCALGSAGHDHVSLMLPQIGRRAAELALAMATGKRKAKVLSSLKEKVPAELVIQESTGPARA